MQANAFQCREKGDKNLLCFTYLISRIAGLAAISQLVYCRFKLPDQPVLL